MSKLMIKGARLSFPSLFEPSMFDGVAGKYEATFLIPKGDKELVSAIEKMMRNAAKEKGLSMSDFAADKRCLRDGDEAGYAGYEGNWSFKARSQRKPVVFDKQKNRLTEDDGTLYAGCVVDAQVDVWIQDNRYGKRINGNLYGVKFVRDGEPFGAGVASADDFEDAPEDDESIDF